MSLRSFPLDCERISFVAIDVEAVPDYAADGSRNGQQRTDAEGRLLYRVNALAIVEGESGGETVSVRVPFDDEPAIVPLSPVRFIDLTARPWAQGDRSGIALVASGVELVHSGNGRARKADPLAESQQAAA